MERSNRNKKSSKKPLILGVSALVLIAAAGGGYYAYSQWQAKQELAEAKKTATTFLNVLTKQKFDKLPSVVQEASLKKNGYDTKSVVEPSLIFPDMSGNDKISIQVDNAKRGEIVDRNGSGLAINKVFDEVGVVPGKLGSGAEKTANIKAFSDKFGVSVDEINQKLSHKRYRVTLLSAGGSSCAINRVYRHHYCRRY